MQNKKLHLLLLLLFPLQMVAQSSLFGVQQGYLSRHDIVYLDPDYNGFNGFPLGNGDMGGMLWLSKDGLEMQINKTDLYEVPQKGRMTLRSAGSLKVDFGCPCFDYIYLSDFEARLSLQEATSTIKSSTPFANTKVESWVDAGKNVWVIDCLTDDNHSSQAGTAPRVSLQRWGSRDFGTWYSVYDDDASKGLGAAKSVIRGRDILLSDKFEGGLSFCLACRVLYPNQQSEQVSDRESCIRLGQSKEKHFQILVSIATSNETADPISAAVSLLDKAEQKGAERLKEEHHDWWQSFWKKSFVHLGDDYLENIYYLRRYLMGSASRGRYLTPFNGSLWVWNKDIRQWVTPHHWNTQQSYWGLAEENDCELIKPYIDTYSRLMPQAEAYAAKRGAKDAILWTEAHDFAGNMVSADWGNMVNDFTPASQMASIFWDYYRFQDDQKCLQDTVYPFMKKAANFYLQYLKWDKAKQQYYIYPSMPYEHDHNSLKNCITDRYMIESLFNHCIRAAKILKTDSKLIGQWQHVISHLWEPPVLNVEGFGETFGLAYYPDGTVYPHPDEYVKSSKAHFHTMDAHTIAVFPADVLGLDETGSRYFNLAKKITLSHPDNINAISPSAIVAARLGLADKTVERLHDMIAYLQHFNQGLFYNIDHWCNLSRYMGKVDSAALVTQRDYVFDSRLTYNSRTGNSGLWAQPFVQCGMETLGVYGAAVNEMLMQCQEGKIRVFPATPSAWESAFTLRADGAFMVSSYKDKQNVIHGVELTSEKGNECRIQNPWPGKSVTLTCKGRKVRCSTDSNGVISFKTERGCTYLLQDATAVPSALTTFIAEPNKRAKHYSEATLGKDRTFNHGAK
jgi:alpha-L-fucosidase 2